MLHYFAYGSNLSEQQMSERCPGSTLVCAGSLSNFRLGFTAYSSSWNGGVADVIESHGDQVFGLLFSLTDEDLRELDRFEGYPRYYSRFVGQIKTASAEYDAWVYAVVTKREFVVPRRQYLQIIKDAAKLHHFPSDYVQMLEGVEVISR